METNIIIVGAIGFTSNQYLATGTNNANEIAIAIPNVIAGKNTNFQDPNWGRGCVRDFAGKNEEKGRGEN